jgi:hypothetical protein
MEIGKTHFVLTSALEEQEIRGAITYSFPSGPVAGYEWRLRVSFLATPDSPERTEWLPWIFATRESVQAMVKQWQHYLSLAEMPPDSPVQ